MTLLLPTPRTVVVHAVRDVAERFRELLVAFLTRPPSRARHRVLTPGQIRWRRWKTAVARYVDSGLRAGPAPQPRAPARPQGEASRTPAWGALHPPPRTAQSEGPARRDGQRCADRPTPATTYALPNASPNDVADGLSPVEPVVWPEASPEPWAETWVEPWPGRWSEPWVEPRTGQAGTCFTGHLWEPASTQRSPAHSVTDHPAADRSAVGEPVFAHAAADRSAAGEPARAHPVADWPAVGEPAHAHPAVGWSTAGESVFAHSTADEPGAAEPVAAEPVAAEPVAVAEPAAEEAAVLAPEVWEFQVGDLARWWDEAIARLDAVARDEVRNRLW